jgi:hypothetical protein
MTETTWLPAVHGIERRSAAIALGLLVLQTACAESPEPRGFAVSDSAGVLFVHNHTPAGDTIRFGEPVVRIGAVDGAPEYLFEWLSDVQPLPDGGVVVVDNRGGRVALFDEGGRWSRDIARRGDGPGEYRTPLHVWLADGELWLWDHVPRRLSRYTAAGEFLGARTLSWKQTAVPPRSVDGGWLDEREWGQQMEPGPAGGALVRVSDAGEVMDTLIGPYPVPRVGWEISDAATGHGHMVDPPTFSAYPVWASDGENLLWSSGAEARVEVRELRGRLTRVILLDREAPRVTDSDIETYIRGMQERFGIPDAELANVREHTVFAEHRPSITGLLVDDRGWIWVSDHDPAAFGTEPAPHWDLCDADGRIQRRVEFPRGFQLKRVQGGRAYGVSVIDEGVHVVDVFTLP